MWRVLTDFADLRDGGHVYRAGDNYPRAGKADPARVKELAGRNNRLGKPLLTPAPEEAPRKVRRKAESKE